MREFSIIVPVYDEAANIAEIHRRLTCALGGIDWEVIFVDDDSQDGSFAEIVRLCERDARVRVIQRIGRRGLSSACVEGVLATTSPFFAIIDGDLQHDETLLPRMLEELQKDRADLVVASRFAPGGSLGSLSKARSTLSRVATWLSKLVTRHSLSDPMSGFFAMRRSEFDKTVRLLSQQGFKLLLDICASSPADLRMSEIPYTFRERVAGNSKLDRVVVLEHVLLLSGKLVGHTVPLRFLLFSFVGAIGLVLHFITLRTLLAAGFGFEAAQIGAVFTAMTSNFFMNNELTYKDRRLTGMQLASGLLSFYAICSVGVVANVGIASYLFSGNQSWQVSGLAGAVIGVFWNYAASSIVTWRVLRRRAIGRP